MPARECVVVGGRIDYIDDPNAPKANSVARPRVGRRRIYFRRPTSNLTPLLPAAARAPDSCVLVIASVISLCPTL